MSSEIKPVAFVFDETLDEEGYVVYATLITVSKNDRREWWRLVLSMDELIDTLDAPENFLS